MNDRDVIILKKIIQYANEINGTISALIWITKSLRVIM